MMTQVGPPPTERPPRPSTPPLPVPKPEPRGPARRTVQPTLTQEEFQTAPGVSQTMEMPVPVQAKPPTPRTISLALKQPRSTKPFRFSELEKVARSEVNLQAQAEWVLPAERSRAASTFQERMKELFEHPAELQLHHVYLTTPGQLRGQLPSPVCLCQVALAPHLPRGLVEVEVALAHAAIDQLLGGASGEAVVLRQLTEIEEGVLSYVMLEGLKALTPTLDPNRPRLRLESFVHSVDEAAELLRSEAHLLVLQFTLGLGDAASGYFRLMLPGSALAELVPARDTEAWRHRRSVLLARHPERLPQLTAALWAEIGHCELSTTDLRSLNPGDVVLVEALTARPDKGEGGTAKLKVAAGQTGHWAADIAVSAEGVQATLTALELGPEAQPRQPEPAALPAERAPEPTTPWDEPENTAVTSRSANPEVDAAELLNDVPLHVAVELGRAAVTAEEIVALRVGQVVTLSKSAGDPVDLSVNGKVVAHGELVEVEGQLGVRITSLSS